MSCGERTVLGDREECWVDRACWENHDPELFSLHFAMQGGYHGAEPEVSLTAFVLVALQEAREVCKDHVNVSGSVLTSTWGKWGQPAPVT